MRKKLHVSVIFNEPTVQTKEGRKFISESGMIQDGNALETARANGLVDMSEVGVVEEREDIQTALNALGYQTSIFNMSNNVDRLLEFLKSEKPDLIFFVSARQKLSESSASTNVVLIPSLRRFTSNRA